MPNTLIIIFLFLLGSIIGSFLNVVIFRLPKRRKFFNFTQRSRCPHCKKVLQPLDLIPIASYLALGGRCRYCHKPISSQYIIVEVLTGLLFLLSYWQFGLSWQTLIGVVGGGSLLVLAFIDGRHKVVPDVVSLPTIGALLVLQAARVFWGGLTPQALQDFFLILLATGLGAGWFFLQWLVSKGRWVGSGDIRLGALLGAYLGLPVVILALFGAYISGSIWAAYLLVRGRVRLKSQLPFGIFLGAAGIISFIFGPSVISWYQQFIGL